MKRIKKLISLFVLTLAFAPLAGTVVEKTFWFFTYRFTVLPILLVLPVFALLGIAIPAWSSRAAQRYSVVERLRQE